MGFSRSARRGVSRLAQVVLFLDGLVVVYLAIDATVILIDHGHTHIWLAWIVGFLPGFALPFFTGLRWIYIGCWVGAPILAAVAGISDPGSDIEQKRIKTAMSYSKSKGFPPRLPASWDDSTGQFRPGTVPSRGFVTATPTGIALIYSEIQEPYPSDVWRTLETTSTVTWELFDRKNYPDGAPGGIGLAGGDQSNGPRIIFATISILF